MAKQQKERKIILLVDYVNIEQNIVSLGKIIDLKKLLEEIIATGIVKDAFIFIPQQYANDENIVHFYNVGYKTIVCPKYFVEMKQKDRVDIIMTDFAERCFDENSDISDLAIVTHDSDFIPLANFMKQRGKNIILYGIKDISVALRQVVNEIKLLPLKDTE